MHFLYPCALKKKKQDIPYKKKKSGLSYKGGEQRNVQGKKIVFGQRPTHEQTSFQEKTRPESLGVVKDFKH